MSNLTSLLILAIGIYGVLLIVAKDTILPQQLRTNSVVQTIYSNNMAVGCACLAAAYYFYTTLPKVSLLHQETSTSDMTSATPEIPVPSYEVATSDVL